MLCCASGQVRLLDHVNSLEQRHPAYELLKCKESGDDEKHFRKYLHLYNNEVAFGSMTMRENQVNDPSSTTLAVRTAVYFNLLFVDQLLVSFFCNLQDRFRGIPIAKINGAIKYNISDLHPPYLHGDDPSKIRDRIWGQC